MKPMKFVNSKKDHCSEKKNIFKKKSATNFGAGQDGREWMGGIFWCFLREDIMSNLGNSRKKFYYSPCHGLHDPKLSHFFPKKKLKKSVKICEHLDY